MHHQSLAHDGVSRLSQPMGAAAGAWIIELQPATASVVHIKRPKQCLLVLPVAALLQSRRP